MPSAPLRYCLTPSCGNKVTRGYCALHEQSLTHQRNHEAGHHWYRTARWRRLRAEVIQAEPFCRDCRTHVREEVHHLRKHNGDETLFFQRDNLSVIPSAHGEANDGGDSEGYPDPVRREASRETHAWGQQMKFSSGRA